MKNLRVSLAPRRGTVSRLVVTASAALILGGCASSASGDIPTAPSTTASLALSDAVAPIRPQGVKRYKILHNFGRGGDGRHPLGALISFNGMLYGVTAFGGHGHGTIFAIDPNTGKESIVHSFAGAPNDGSYPMAGLLNVAGALYGTTKEGGHSRACLDHGCGTVFSFNLYTGEERVVHSFSGSPSDGRYPESALINAKGTLYGTTAEGGAFRHCRGNGGCGTVFAINPETDQERVVYSFGGTPDDGWRSVADLIDVGNALYGTTLNGGANDYGTVFAVNTKTGKEHVLHSFGDKFWAVFPYAGLINVGGTLYGTTFEGGSMIPSVCGPSGCGTIFSVDLKSGQVREVYSFTYSHAGAANPEAPLVDVAGTLYGTTLFGGNYGYGAMFAFNPRTGKESLVHRFDTFWHAAHDGLYPSGGLLDVGGKLYGLTAKGGGPWFGGIAFELTP